MLLLMTFGTTLVIRVPWNNTTSDSEKGIFQKKMDGRFAMSVFVNTFR